ncbi:MAG: hypothetical protein ACRCWF_04510 [Beijerinckiaceae bacterium]
MPFSDPTLIFLLVKMLVTAAIVVSASLIAERTGPLVAAMVATLPVSAGPVYFFLAMEHSDAFIGEAALGSIGASFATLAFSVAYGFAAQRLGMAMSLFLAFAIWTPVLLLLKTLNFSAGVYFLLVVVLFMVAHIAMKPFLDAKPAKKPSLAWYVIPVRALLVAALVGTLTTISWSIGPQWSGYFATFPVVLSTLILFLHPRIGGKPTAAIIGSGVLGLMGFSFALGFVSFAAVPLGKWTALSLGLAICILWNLALVMWSRRA